MRVFYHKRHDILSLYYRDVIFSKEVPYLPSQSAMQQRFLPSRNLAFTGSACVRRDVRRLQIHTQMINDSLLLQCCVEFKWLFTCWIMFTWLLCVLRRLSGSFWCCGPSIPVQRMIKTPEMRNGYLRYDDVVFCMQEEECTYQNTYQSIQMICSRKDSDRCLPHMQLREP